MNAYTSREHTAYYLRLPAAQFGFGVDLLADVVTAPAFRPHEVDAEREVILEELLMSEDTPDDLVLTALYESLFPEHPLGRETLGTRETVGGHDPRRHRRVPPAAGTGRPTSWWRRPATSTTTSWSRRSTACWPAGDGGQAPVRRPPRQTCRPLVVLDRPIEQAHVAVGLAGPVGRTTTTATPSGSPTTSSAEGCRAACSRRSARSGASPTPCSPRPSSHADCGSLSLYAATAPSAPAELLAVTRGVLEEAAGRRGHRRGARGGGRLPRGLDAARAGGQRRPDGATGERLRSPATRPSPSTSTSAASGPSPRRTSTGCSAGCSTPRGRSRPSGPSAGDPPALDAFLEG